jgi:outer membrane protein assembly factor BamE (lipoprotein component of BamABCDE complex)
VLIKISIKNQLNLGVSKMQGFLKTYVALIAVVWLSGCSVYMAANQPPAKNIDLFKVGTPRSALLAEFGYPTSTETKADGKKYDIYRFTQGYSGGG